MHEISYNLHAYVFRTYTHIDAQDRATPAQYAVSVNWNLDDLLPLINAPLDQKYSVVDTWAMQG